MDLTDAYENGAYIPDAARFLKEWPADAAVFRADMAARFEAGFDADTRRGADIVWPAGKAKGLLVFVHGGYWRRFSPRDWTQFAKGALARGWAVALPGYPLCPDVRIAEITDVITQTICDLAGRFEGPMVLAGHSAGGHLVARMAETLPPAVRNRVERIAPISMLSDLAPLLQTEMNADLQLDEAEAKAESPLRYEAPEGIEVRLWVGGDERPVFIDQSRWLAEAWAAPLTIAEGLHHFDIIDALKDSESDMVQWLCP